MYLSIFIPSVTLCILLGVAPAQAETDALPTAIVVQDQVALRAAPQDNATQQATLWQGDSVEVRGERLGFVQVYDHRRERAGFLRGEQLRRVSTRADDAAELLAVVRFLRDTPGVEALGIAYVGAFLKAAPGERIGSEAFAALGTFAQRLADRASARHARTDDAALAAHLEVAASLGVVINSIERDGRMRLCYDGEAFRRVLALPATDAERALAALALTRPDCIDPDLAPAARYALDQWRVEVLERAPPENLPAYLQNRLRLRRAAILASFAFQHARRGEDAQDSMNLALQALAGVDKLQFAPEDALAYNDAAVRVGASRWSAEASPKPAGGLGIVTHPGEPGQTCIALVDARHPANAPLTQRCTYGVVWAASARTNASSTALTLAVQPMDSWRELWVFQRDESGWRIDIVPPGLETAELGYVEFAGWVPGKPQFLAAREIRVAGRFRKSFEVIDLDTLAVRNHADQPSSLGVFHRWQDPLWKRQTVAVR